MKNVSIEMSNESLVVIAGLFDITTEGVETATLVESINSAIEDLKSGKASRAKAKWFEVEGAYPYTEGDVVKITSGDILVGRFAEVVRPSSKANAIKAYLLTPKEGERQGTLITLDFDKIEKSAFVPVAPKVTKKDTAVTETPASSESQGASGESQDTGAEAGSGEEVAV